MKETAIQQAPKTALEVFRMLPEGTLCEVIDNVLYMSPAPKYEHQRLLLLFAQKIANHLQTSNLGELIVAPFDVYFDDLLSAVQPDLIFVSNENRAIIKADGYMHGAPDQIIEILSNDRKRDTVQKKNLYERAGVKEYHIIDPANKKAWGYVLEDEHYKAFYETEGNFRSELLNLEFEF